jgi:hypothetical protein
VLGGEPEVRNLGRAIGPEQDVRRLDVPVDDPASVGEGERVADRGHDPHDLGLAERPGIQGRLQVGALDVLHHQHRPAHRLQNLVHLDDVGVLQSGRDRRL